MDACIHAHLPLCEWEGKVFLLNRKADNIYLEMNCNESSMCHGTELYTTKVYICCMPVSSTSSCMPHSNSIVTQASMGKAISLPLIFRCSSRDLPNEGFSTHASAKQNSSLTHKTQTYSGNFYLDDLRPKIKKYYHENSH